MGANNCRQRAQIEKGEKIDCAELPIHCRRPQIRAPIARYARNNLDEAPCSRQSCLRVSQGATVSSPSLGDLEIAPP